MGLDYFKSDTLKHLGCHGPFFNCKRPIFENSGPVSLLVNSVRTQHAALLRKKLEISTTHVSSAVTAKVAAAVSSTIVSTTISATVAHILYTRSVVASLRLRICYLLSWLLHASCLPTDHHQDPRPLHLQHQDRRVFWVAVDSIAVAGSRRTGQVEGLAGSMAVAVEDSLDHNRAAVKMTTFP